MSTKTCRECGRDLPLSEFYKNKDTKDGLLNACKVCWKTYQKVHRYADRSEANPKERERIDARQAEWEIARQTGTLGDIIEAQEIIARLGIKATTLRWWRSRQTPYGLDFPTPIYRPENQKPIWLRSEFEEFERKLKAAKAVKRKRPGEGT